MKLLILALLSFALVSCASNREPSSVDETEQRDVSRGINSDSYNPR